MPSKPQMIAENEWLIAVDKPAGLKVHSDGRTDEPTLADWLIEHFPNLAAVGEWESPQGNRYPLGGAVHRLDRTTSGVILVAKNQKAFSYLKNEFKEKRIEKLYRTYVNGEIAENGKIVAEIMRSSTPPKKWYARACDESDSRAAITTWKRLASHDGISYVEVQPLTGRTHQIRVHFASIGHPLLGDTLYGDPADRFSRPLLHAYSISVSLPNGKRETYKAELPDDFRINGQSLGIE